MHFVRLQAKNQEIKQSLNPSTTQLQSLLLDPAVNLMFQHMKQELEGARSKLEQAQGELSAWKFTPDRLVIRLNPVTGSI